MRESVLAQLGHTFPITLYYQHVKDLADHMSRTSMIGKPWADDDYWWAAERHMCSILDGILETSKSASEALILLSEKLQLFSSEEHLRRIREIAFETWESSTKQYSPLHYWLIAENQFLQSLREPERPNDTVR